MIQEVVRVPLAVSEDLVIQKRRIGSGSPRLCVVTGTHGDELEGQYVAWRLNRLLGLVFESVGEEAISSALAGMGILQPMLTALVGLVPNCAASVLLAQLYMEGAISFGSLFAGLTAGAGVGLAVLWRVNPSWKQNLFMTGLLWAVGAVAGMLLQVVA